MPVCADVNPPPTAVGPGHVASCHLLTPVTLKSDPIAARTQPIAPLPSPTGEGLG
jgi:hypothetical protein